MLGGLNAHTAEKVGFQRERTSTQFRPVVQDVRIEPQRGSVMQHGEVATRPRIKPQRGSARRRSGDGTQVVFMIGFWAWCGRTAP